MHDTDVDNDDLPVGRVLTRRETLALFGMSAVALLTGCGTTAAAQGVQGADGVNAEAATAANPTGIAAQGAAVATTTTTNTANAAAITGCVVRPEMTEGPYFVDEQLDRSDIRLDPANGALSAGVPLALTFAVQQVGGAACTPLAGATVDIWQCDALGVYSDVQSEGSAGKKFLRGSQTTDANGAATFTTIYPGWYRGRAVHIHFKVRTVGAAGEAYEFTSQLFFDDALSDAVFTQAPYAGRGTRDTRNARDGIFSAGGDQMTLTPAKTDTGYAATFAVGLDLADTRVGRADGNSGGGPGGGFPGGRPGMPPSR